MKINKFVKKGNGMYSINLEDETTIIAHEDIILKYDLLLRKNISLEEIDKIESENLLYSSYNVALKYVTIKMRSKKEVQEYLKKKSVDNCFIEKVIEMLEKTDYINDEKYAIAFINDKISLTNDGPEKIVRNLIENGVNENIARDKIKLFSKEIELEKIDKLILKFQKTNHNKSANALKNKIALYLVNQLGYTKSIVMEAIDNTSFIENQNIKNKEYEKAYKKLSRKYSGKELEYKLKQKMYSLGFKEYID